MKFIKLFGLDASIYCLIIPNGGNGYKDETFFVARTEEINNISIFKILKIATGWHFFTLRRSSSTRYTQPDINLRHSYHSGTKTPAVVI